MNPSNNTQQVIQPARNYNQKRRLARALRAKGRAYDIPRVVWNKDNAPKKGR